MTEASVSSAFMTALRKRLPDAVVIKHHDASFIGLPDCSVTWRGRSFWLEFKLWVPPKKWDNLSCDVLAIAEKSPVQYEMMKRLDKASTAAFYVVWAKKSGLCFVTRPVDNIFYTMRIPQEELVEQMVRGLEYYAQA